jgi:hypothetical protein
VHAQDHPSHGEQMTTKCSHRTRHQIVSQVVPTDARHALRNHEG